MSKKEPVKVAKTMAEDMKSINDPLRVDVDSIRSTKELYFVAFVESFARRVYEENSTPQSGLDLLDELRQEIWDELAKCDHEKLRQELLFFNYVIPERSERYFSSCVNIFKKIPKTEKSNLKKIIDGLLESADKNAKKKLNTLFNEVGLGLFGFCLAEHLKKKMPVGGDGEGGSPSNSPGGKYMKKAGLAY